MSSSNQPEVVSKLEQGTEIKADKRLNTTENILVDNLIKSDNQKEIWKFFDRDLNTKNKSDSELAKIEQTKNKCSKSIDALLYDVYHTYKSEQTFVESNKLLMKWAQLMLLSVKLNGWTATGVETAINDGNYEKLRSLLEAKVAPIVSKQMTIADEEKTITHQEAKSWKFADVSILETNKNKLDASGNKQYVLKSTQSLPFRKNLSSVDFAQEEMGLIQKVIDDYNNKITDSNDKIQIVVTWSASHYYKDAFVTDEKMKTYADDRIFKAKAKTEKVLSDYLSQKVKNKNSDLNYETGKWTVEWPAWPLTQADKPLFMQKINQTKINEYKKLVIKSEDKVEKTYQPW